MTIQSKAALSYVFGFISGFILLIFEKDNEFIRKCSSQSIVFSLSYIILSFIFKIIPFIGFLLNGCLLLLSFVIWVILIIKAHRNIYYKLPLISYISENYIMKIF